MSADKPFTKENLDGYLRELAKEFLMEQNEPQNEPQNANSVEDAILQLIRMNKYVTREEMASQIEVSLSTVKRSINKLKTSGIIEYEGPSKGGYWIIKGAGK